MAENSSSERRELAAGDFSLWADGIILGAIRGEEGSDVPCGSCTACCTSSQFVHIGPDETDTLSRIPPELVFPAPRLPDGHVVLGYDERGHCPMLVDGQCSIYEHRPRTCRVYDCRVFPAAGLIPEGDAKVLIAGRAQQWKFSYRTQADRSRHEAVRAAATFLDQHRDLLPDGATNATRLAVLALEVHDLFIRGDAGAAEATVDPDLVRPRLNLETSVGAWFAEVQHGGDRAAGGIRRPAADALPSQPVVTV